MKARVAASVVLAVGVVLGTAGCNLIAPQDTTKIQQPTAFGQEGMVGDVDIRNAYLVADGDAVSLVATFVNDGTSGATMSIQPNASSSDTTNLLVPSGAPTVVGPDQHVQWSGLDAAPGSLLPVFFTYGDKTGVKINLPVLTGDFQVNSTLTPTPVATETPAG
ncbi:MAG TPA: hypothetical protein VGC45_07530 [Gryllotalpicola sp.]